MVSPNLRRDAAGVAPEPLTIENREAVEEAARHLLDEAYDTLALSDIDRIAAVLAALTALLAMHEAETRQAMIAGCRAAIEAADEIGGAA
jgi:hypothetical protein